MIWDFLYIRGHYLHNIYLIFKDNRFLLNVKIIPCSARKTSDTVGVALPFVRERRALAVFCGGRRFDGVLCLVELVQNELVRRAHCAVRWSKGERATLLALLGRLQGSADL